MPRVTSANDYGLEASHAETVGETSLSSLWPCTVSAWQAEMKWTAFSEPTPHSLQEGSPAGRPAFLDLKRAASFSSLLHPMRRQILKLLSRVRVTDGNAPVLRWLEGPDFTCTCMVVRTVFDELKESLESQMVLVVLLP